MRRCWRTGDFLPEDPQQVAELMDIHKGTERTLREVLFPAIRQSYEELLAAVEDGAIR
jgi:hypothetical protein